MDELLNYYPSTTQYFFELWTDKNNRTTKKKVLQKNVCLLYNIVLHKVVRLFLLHSPNQQVGFSCRHFDFRFHQFGNIVREEQFLIIFLWILLRQKHWF